MLKGKSVCAFCLYTQRQSCPPEKLSVAIIGLYYVVHQPTANNVHTTKPEIASAVAAQPSRKDNCRWGGLV